jgi:dienelactone hydrolase
MKKSIVKSIAVAGSLFAAATVSAPAEAIDSFTATYKNGSNCGSNYNISGREPSLAGTYPVFVYMVGTSESYTHASAIAAVTSMADRGYVAATVAYPNSTFGDCSAIGAKAQCVFNPNSASSAINTLCSRAKADCSKGVVVSGFSQGSIMAILSKNYDPRVDAAYALGAGVQYSGYDLRACVANGKRSLPSSQLRVVNGEVDGFMGSSASSVRSQLQELTGLSCGTSAFSCLQSNGSGWYMVKGAEVSDGSADHCYMRSGGCLASKLDSIWQTGAAPWSLEINLDWLSAFTLP